MRLDDGRGFLGAQLDENQNVGMAPIPYDELTLQGIERSSEKLSVTFIREAESSWIN